METIRLSSKGQIVLPKPIRDARQWAAGATFEVELLADGVMLRPLKAATSMTLDQVAGCLKVAGPARSIAEMDDAVLAEARARHGRR